MKQLNYYLIFVLAMLCGINTVKAEIVQNYKMDFSKYISTQSHDFKVGSSWGHIVSYYTASGNDYYVPYEYNASSGHDGVGCLGCGDQTALGPYSNRGSANDILVTPKVKGKVGIWATKKAYTTDLKFYKVTKTSEGYVLGDEIAPTTTPTYNWNTWTQVEIPELTEETYIGLYVCGLTIDDFYADQADVTKEAGLHIQQITNNGEAKPYCNEDNKFDINFSVKIQNTGDLDLAAGTEGYSLSLVNQTNGDAVVFTSPITEPIAIGEYKEITITGQVDASVYPEYNSYNVKENVSNTKAQYAVWIEPVPYLPILNVSSNGVTQATGTAVDFHKINRKATRSFLITNRGGAPMQNLTATAPAGFTTNFAEPFTLAAGEEKTLEITALADAAGEYNGTLTISATGIEDYTFKLSATVLDPNKFYANFEDQQLPPGSYVEKNWDVTQRDVVTSDNVYFLKNHLVGADDKFVTPLLKVEEGEALSIDVGKVSKWSTGTDAYLNIYYSTDRHNWTLARQIIADELSSDAGSTSYSYSNYAKLTNFSITEIPAGNWYIGFGAGYTTIDNIYGYDIVPVTHDISLLSSEIQKTGSVNYPLVAKVTMKNLNTKPEPAGSYTMKLYFDEDVVATADATAIPACSDTTFTFDIKPHKVGEYKAYAVFENADDNIRFTTDTVNVTIGEEQFKSTLTIGSGEGKQNDVAIYWYYADSGGTCDSFYPVSMLQKYGMSSGAKIKSITMRGTTNTDKTYRTTTADAYIGFATDGDTPANPCADYEGLNHISIYNNEDVNITSSEGAVNTFSFAEPLVWDGTTALRICTYIKSRDYGYIYYKVDDTEKHSYAKGYSMANGPKNNPIIEIELDAKPAALTGKVSCGETALANATVTLRSDDDVVYTTTTAEDGTYSLNVMQAGKKYQLTATAEGYDDFTAADSLSFDTDMVKDIQMVNSFVAFSGNATYHKAPLAGVTVTLSREGEENLTATTGEDGTFKFDAVRHAQSYTLTATAEGYNDYTTAEPVAVGDEDFVLPTIEMTKPLAKATGIVKYHGSPLKDATVTLTADNADVAAATAATDAEGKFAIDVEQDYSYTLAVNMDGFNAYAATEAVPVNGDKDFGTVVMTKPLAKATGIVMCSGKALENATVTLTTLSGTDYTATAATDAEGKFEMNVEQDFNYLLSAKIDRYEDFTAADSVLVDATEKDFGTVEMTAKFFTLTVPENNYMMFSSTKAVDFTAEGLKAYVVTEVKAKEDDAYTVLAEVSKVPANTGVIIYAPAGDYELNYADAADVVKSNLLVSTASDAFTGTTADKNKAWIFGFKDTTPLFSTDDNLTAEKGGAYLRFESKAKNIYLFEKDVPKATGICNIYGEGGLDLNAPMFNLSGQEVGKNYRGVVIQNGKKFNKK